MTRLLAGFALLASAVLAQAQSPAPSAWTPAPDGGAVAPENPAAVERVQFGNQFQNQGMDQWCDQVFVAIPISQDMVEQLPGAQLLAGGIFNGNRQFFRYRNGEAAISDQLDLGLNVGYSLSKVLKAGRVFGVYFGASIEGQSIVTRPLHGSDSCKGIKRILNPRDFKTVLPLSGERLAQMDIGELWIIPMKFQIAFEPLDAAEVPPMGSLKTTPTAAFMSLGLSKTADPTITIFRAGPKEIRLKLHLDRIQAFNAQVGGVFGPIPATDIGSRGVETILSRVLPDLLPGWIKLFSRQFDSILGIQLGLSYTQGAGQQIFLQYTLDPTDPEQMGRLAKVIRGDLSVLGELMQFAKAISSEEPAPAMMRDLEKLRQKHDLELKLPADLAGIDNYDPPRGWSENFSVPVALVYSHGVARTHDHYVTEKPEKRDIESFKVLETPSVSFLHFPFLGPFINHNTAEGVQVMVDVSDAAGESKGKPQLIYTRDWGILRERPSILSDALTKTDELMATVGPDASAAQKLRLPPELLDSRDSRFHKGYFNLSLVCGADCVQKLMSVSASEVFGAIAQGMTGGEREIFDKMVARVAPAARGAEASAEETWASIQRYDKDANARTRWFSQVYAAASSIESRTMFVHQKLGELRALAAEPARQAAVLFDLASGKGGLTRDDFQRVVLRLTSPDNIAGDILLHLDKEETNASNYTAYYVLNPLLFGDDVLKAMSVVQRSFFSPTAVAPVNE